MATVLFAHDGYMYKNNQGIYSDTYNNKIIERYLDIAENVVFMVRINEHSKDIKKLNKLDINNFSVVGIENFKSLRGVLKFQEIIESVKHQVQKADYIVVRIPSDLGFLAAKYAAKYNKRYMVEVVGCPWDSLRNHSVLGKVIAPYYYVMQKATIGKAPYAIYVTNQFLQQRYPCRGNSIGCSDVEIQNLDDNVLAMRIEKLETRNLQSLVFGTMGTLNMKYKGYDTVIKAIIKLKKEGYLHKYLIAGSGDASWLNSIIHKYNAENIVTIVPVMPHEKVFDWLDSIDVYIQPSKTEGMPRALIEAMSRACPCIGSDAGGIPELLKSSFVFPRGNVEKVASIIRNLYKNQLNLMAGENFESCSKFDKEQLKVKRAEFYESFKAKK